MPSVHRGQKALDPLELQLLIVWSTMWYWGQQNVLSCWAISPVPIMWGFIVCFLGCSCGGWVCLLAGYCAYYSSAWSPNSISTLSYFPLPIIYSAVEMYSAHVEVRGLLGDSFFCRMLACLAYLELFLCLYLPCARITIPRFFIFDFWFGLVVLFFCLFILGVFFLLLLLFEILFFVCLCHGAQEPLSIK